MMGYTTPLDSTAAIIVDMVDPHIVTAVESLVRGVNERLVLPRFRRLTPAQVATKTSEQDLVTVADQEAEEALSEALTLLLPGSVVVGEEAVSADPDLLGLLDASDPVWIIDPIDGTHNFVAGSSRFTTLVTLAQAGQLLASWTYAPFFGTIGTAVSGAGAFVDGQPVRVCPAPQGLRNLDVSTTHPSWCSADQRKRLNVLSDTGVALTYFDTSGMEYLGLASGRRSAMVVTWDNPWDHAAGLLLHAEAGGHSATRGGEPFRLVGDNVLPFAVGPDPVTVAALLAALALPDDEAQATC